MNNQKLHKQSAKESEGIDNRRRFIKGAGIAAPVVLTLASGSVFGAQCFSGLQSSNLSHHKKDDSCWGGQSPGFWMTFYKGTGGGTGVGGGGGGGTGGGNSSSQLNQGKSCPFGDSKTACWNATKYTYGGYGNGSTTDLINGIGHNGTKLSATVLSHVSNDSRTLSQILLNENGSPIWHVIAAMLNSYYCASKGQHYILTPAQFDGLIDGSIPVPGGGNVLDFIKTFADASYHDLANDPGTTCKVPDYP